MAYDESLAARIRALGEREPGLTEQRMFGGLAFLIGGNMAVAARGGGGLLLRIDPEEADVLLRDPDAEPFVMRGRAMDGWLGVRESGVQTDAALERWVAAGVRRARALPPKG